MSWEKIPFIKVCDFQGGTQPPKSVFKLKPQDGYVRLLQIQDFNNDDKAVYIPDTPRLKKCLEEDILLGRYGASIGRVLTGKQGAYNVAIVKLIPDIKRLDRRFLFHFLGSIRFQNFLKNVGTRAAQAGFNKKDFERLKLPLPPLEEQRRIAAILDKADGVRRKRKEAIALTEELLRSAFLEMFGDPVTNPKGWDIVPIESVAASTKNALAIGPFGSSLKVDDYRKSGHPVVFVRDIRENRFDWISQVFVDDKKFQELQSHHVRPGDVVATKMGLPPCIAAVYPDSMPIGVVTADIIKMTLDRNKMTPIYAAAAINSDFCKRQVARFTEGITRPKVTLRDFRELQIPCPPLSYQKRWEALCHQHQKTATKLSTDFDALNDLFNSLLQRAFRGEL
jgi:type I restriction enzyme S subunit